MKKISQISIILLMLISHFGGTPTIHVFAGTYSEYSSNASESLLYSSKKLLTNTALLVKDINPGQAGSMSSGFYAEAIGDTLFFSAGDSHGLELWKTNGTEDSTVMLADMNPLASFQPDQLINVDGALFFSANDGTKGQELWKSDGTETGTILIKDINPNSGYSTPEFLKNLNGYLFFTAYDPVHGRELWISDGTSNGTNLILDINPGNASSTPENLITSNGLIYFSADDGIHGNELWMSNGTPEGTVMVKDIVLGMGGSFPNNLTDLNGIIYFSGAGELWKSNGTEYGTTLVKDINSTGASDPRYIKNVNGVLYFIANDDTHGAELWKSNGTFSGTVLVKDIWLGSNGGGFDFTYIDNVIFLGKNDGVNGWELWKSDGTTTGTVMVKDIVPGSGSSGPSDLFASGGKIYFSASDGEHGAEIWQSDGTDTGTIMLTDINPTGDSHPSMFFDIQGKVYFRANDGIHGSELWKIDQVNIPTNWIVTNINDTGSGSLRNAIENSSSGDTITFALTLSGQTIRLQSTLAIDKHITIDASVLSERIILSADSDNDGDGDVMLLNVLASGSVTIKNIEFAKGYTSSSLNAGAITNLGSLSVYDSKFILNQGTQGGAIRNNGTLIVENCEFLNNTSSNNGEGGAIMNNLGATATIRNSSFTENSGAGGAIGNVGTLTIENSTFSNNSSLLGGGALVNSFNGTTKIYESTFTGNSTQGNGGAIYNLEGVVEIYQSTFSNNSAKQGGAIIAGTLQYGNNTTTLISESIISDNQASLSGGAIEFDSGSSMIIDKTTISGNTSAAAGGIANISGNLLTITNSTIANNIATQAPGPGGIIGLNSPVTIKNSTITGNNYAAVYVQGNTTISNTTIAGNPGYGLEVLNFSLSIKNSIIANNNIDCSLLNGATLSISQNNLIETNNGCGTPASITDPLLGSLANNGGSTQTIALLPNSPAIDMGNNTSCEATDQRGITRPQGSSCDIGAFEYQDLTSPSVTSIVRTSANPISAPSVEFAITFSESVQNVDINDFSLFTSGVSGVTITSVTPVSTSVYTVTVNTGSGNGTIRLDVPVSATIKDLSNNNLSGLPYTTGESYTIVSLTTIDVSISAVNQGSYAVNPGSSLRKSYTGVDNGPVKVDGNGGNVIAAERVIYYAGGVPTSFTEMMGLPSTQIDDEYWFPWYDNVNIDTNLRFGNVSGAPASVQVFIGGVEMPGSPFALTASGAGQSLRVSFAGVNNGPVHIVSTQPIVAAERIIYNPTGSLPTSFSEMMGLPASQVNTTFVFPWYNNLFLDTQLRFANVSGSTATVNVYIGGTLMPGSPFTLPASGAGQSKLISFAGIDSGPVRIVSNQPIVASERTIYNPGTGNTSFTEMMGLPESLVNTTYYFPWYNNLFLDTQLRFGNVSGVPASVRVYIGGVEMAGSPFALTASGTGQSLRISFAGIDNGPVKIVSDQPIVAAEREIYLIGGVPVSFTEMMGLPNSLLNSSYWFPWYNNLYLDTQLRFGAP
ncbi:MAG: ELWxxDGT repeat protein [Anaerolineales bacterium]